MSLRILFTSTLAISLGLLIAGCSTDAEPGPTKAAVAPPTTAKADALPVHRDAEGRLLCPVMKTVIASEKEAVGFADHDGERYYFCCAMCPDKFKADPHAFVSHS